MAKIFTLADTRYRICYMLKYRHFYYYPSWRIYVILRFLCEIKDVFDSMQMKGHSLFGRKNDGADTFFSRKNEGTKTFFETKKTSSPARVPMNFASSLNVESSGPS